MQAALENWQLLTCSIGRGCLLQVRKRAPRIPPNKVFFGAYPPDRRLSVVQRLKHYEDRTKEFRDNHQDQAAALQRIAHCPNIDTSIFTAHSVRGASATAARGDSQIIYIQQIGAQTQPSGISIISQ